jgi:hypothetical protein
VSLLTLTVAAWAQGVEPGSCPAIGWPTPFDPALARERQQVTVQVTVDPAGVATVQPVDGPATLAAVLVERLPACRWRPAEADGLPVPGTVEVVWTFDAVPPQVTGVVLRRGSPSRTPPVGSPCRRWATGPKPFRYARLAWWWCPSRSTSWPAKPST